MSHGCTNVAFQVQTPFSDVFSCVNWGTNSHFNTINLNAMTEHAMVLITMHLKQYFSSTILNKKETLFSDPRVIQLDPKGR